MSSKDLTSGTGLGVNGIISQAHIFLKSCQHCHGHFGQMGKKKSFFRLLADFMSAKCRLTLVPAQLWLPITWDVKYLVLSFGEKLNKDICKYNLEHQVSSCRLLCCFQ